MNILAIDQGTTSTRALRVDADGRSEITHAVQHRQYYPGPGRVEHDANEIIASIEACIAASPGIDAIGIDNQGESCLAWDAKTREPLCPVIVWQDNRTQDAIDALGRDGHEERVLELSGLPLDSYFSASKLAWILNHVDGARDLLQQGRLRLGTTDAYFLDRLTGRFVTDISTASRTSLMNLESGQWDPELCELFGVPVEALPEIVPTTGEFGSIEAQGRSIPVTASVVDQQASLYGHGCRSAGDTKITFGTGAFALMVTGNEVRRSPQQGLLPTVAWQRSASAPVYALDGGVYCAGSAIEWARKLNLFDDYAEINAFDRPTAIERGLAFVPALSGLACPHWDRRAAGLWIGLSLETDKRDMVQALLEGIAFRAAEVVTAMSEFARVGERVSIDGGVSVNPWFCQFLADLLQRRVTVNAMAELTALGTAALASDTETGIVGADGEQTDYLPGPFDPGLRDRFSEAVSRAKGWRD